MRAMTKSAVRLVHKAIAVGRSALVRYSSRFSRHDYTQAQFFALRVLKQFLRTDYRGLVALLAEWGELRRVVGLKKVPHYSTLCYAERWLLEEGPRHQAPRRRSSSKWYRRRSAVRRASSSTSRSVSARTMASRARSYTARQNSSLSWRDRYTSPRAAPGAAITRVPTGARRNSRRSTRRPSSPARATSVRGAGPRERAA